MRRLILIRHAKSSWENLQVADHDRPLNMRGEYDRIAMASYLAVLEASLDVVYSSTAVRASSFAKTICEVSDCELRTESSLYTFDADELLSVISQFPDSLSCVAVVGHNPAITLLINRLTEGDVGNVPTAGIAAINCDVAGWQDIDSGSGRLDYFHYPKKLY